MSDFDSNPFADPEANANPFSVSGLLQLPLIDFFILDITLLPA